jgi:hypothetical protein
MLETTFAANRTRNRTLNCTQNRTCRLPQTKLDPNLAVVVEFDEEVGVVMLFLISLYSFLHNAISLVCSSIAIVESFM